MVNHWEHEPIVGISVFRPYVGLQCVTSYASYVVKCVCKDMRSEVTGKGIKCYDNVGVYRVGGNYKRFSLEVELSL